MYYMWEREHILDENVWQSSFCRKEVENLDMFE